MCSGSKGGSYLRLIDIVYLSILGLRIIKKRIGFEAELFLDREMVTLPRMSRDHMAHIQSRDHMAHIQPQKGLLDRCSLTSGYLTPRFRFQNGEVSHSHYQSTPDAVSVYVAPWSEFPIVPSYPHYPQGSLLPSEEGTP